MTGERGLTIQRLTRDHFRETSLESPIVRLVSQRTIQSWGRHFERVLPAERCLIQLLVLHVEQGAQILTDPLAIFDADRLFWGFLATPRSGRSMITRSTVPMDSRRSCTSKISSPQLRATRSAAARTRVSS